MSEVAIKNADLKELADAAMELVKIRTQRGESHDSDRYRKLVASCSQAYFALQGSIDITGVYRCLDCGSDWKITSMGEALKCPHCQKQHIEPVYATGVDDFDSHAAEQALANHERCFPAKTQKGEYCVEVTRVGFSKATVRVKACGPSSAILQAEELAPSVEFRSDYASEYEVQGVSEFIPDIVGERFFWEDPDGCSGAVTVERVNGEMISCTKDDGGSVEAYLNELKPL